VRVHGAYALRPGVSTIADSQGNDASGKKIPSPRRVAQEGYMATPICHHELAEI
jgi:hypothetical protein